MGTQQIILVIGGMVLLGLLALTFYNSYNTKTDLDIYNQAIITASGIGQSMIDEIQAKAFDEKTVSKRVNNVSQLTAVGALGPDSGETSPANYDDIDDYKNYMRLDTLNTLGVFTTRVDVNYAVKLNPNQTSSSQTFAKRIDVFVTNTYLKDTLKLNSISTY
ncbi:MAG: hypothetical protein AB1775_09385 [Bacteroidota bacterium]